jgi:hypothetical protein
LTAVGVADQVDARASAAARFSAGTAAIAALAAVVGVLLQIDAAAAAAALSGAAGTTTLTTVLGVVHHVDTLLAAASTAGLALWPIPAASHDRAVGLIRDALAVATCSALRTARAALAAVGNISHELEVLVGLAIAVVVATVAGLHAGHLRSHAAQARAAGHALAFAFAAGRYSTFHRA